MAPERAPAFQFYPKDFLMDGNVAAMSLAERGAYITLLCLCWQERTLPAQTSRLARMVGVTPAAFSRLWPALKPCFRAIEAEPDRLIHPRLERERASQDAFRRRQREAGLASAANRKATTVQPDSNHGSTEAQPEGNSSISHLPSPKERERAREADGAGPDVLDAFRTAWKAAYGYECSLLLKPLDQMQLDQQTQTHGSVRLAAAITAYFAADDAFVRRARHPLALFLRDPLKYLAKEAVAGRPKGCRHEPACADDAAHTARDLADRRAS